MVLFFVDMAIDYVFRNLTSRKSVIESPNPVPAPTPAEQKKIVENTKTNGIFEQP